MPSGETHQRLARLIFRLSEEYSTPLFEPHITLLGGLTATEDRLQSLSHQLAARLTAFEVPLTRADYLDEFHRALFVRVAEIEPVMNANRQARDVFGREQGSAYMPHLSLLYGNLSQDLKEEILSKIGREFNTSFPVNRFFLQCTTGDTKDWYRLGEFLMAAEV